MRRDVQAGLVACLTGELLAEGSVRRSLRCVLSSLCCNSCSTKEKRSRSTACISMMSAQQQKNHNHFVPISSCSQNAKRKVMQRGWVHTQLSCEKCTACCIW